ncbi:hypothetical protein MMC30_001508 [Trapelia coarctata]|nr:hypothetical protein [Trapelia coarctata]
MFQVQRQDRANPDAAPAEEPFVRVSQEARRNGYLENIAEGKLPNPPFTSKHHRAYPYPLVSIVNFSGSDTDALFSFKDKAPTSKYGAEKSKVFPTAARLQAIRRVLEGFRDGAVPPRPEGVDSSSWSTFKNDCKSTYAIDEHGAIIRRGVRNGYVVPVENIHQVLSWAHEQIKHGGRDQTYKHIVKYYSKECFPKDFVVCWAAGCRGHTHREVRERPVDPGATNTKPTSRAVVMPRWEAARPRVEARDRKGSDFWATHLAEDRITVALLGLPQPEWTPADNMGPVDREEPAMAPVEDMELDGFPLPQPAVDQADDEAPFASPQRRMDPTDADGLPFTPPAMGPTHFNFGLDKRSLETVDLENADFRIATPEFLRQAEAGVVNGTEQRRFHQPAEDPIRQFTNILDTNADGTGDFVDFDAFLPDQGLTSGESAGSSPNGVAAPTQDPAGTPMTEELPLPDDFLVITEEDMQQLEDFVKNWKPETINPAWL